ncbi:hypothetical protein A2442_01760 [Candidatus Campbellbacteria bacterium RIFOXYC2_FULL_35_25]|uniref:SHS2 domain-containing protein n=1 Tax=Candidatus Campbellbacteria bacterium RIFOXYC2_FULL_35_25 TaxID=1797582 RepID=A0A1F5EK39_9BACT|nr:MAG: hypothetical protein A2442_01760 [Candidatus Campbellbacteria bacterium RIFOXYC2_FULL_35_25]
MTSFFSSQKKGKQEIAAIFDIGSSSVGGAIVLIPGKKEDKPKILYSVREQMVFHEKLDANKFIDSMLKTLNSVVSDLEKNGLVHLNFLKIKNKAIKNAFCFFSSPWCVSQTKKIKIKKDKSFEITESLLKSIIQKEEEAFIKLESGEYSSILGKNNEIDVMDKKIIQIKLNGYIVNNPYKKKVKEAETSFFMSLLSRDISEKIQKSIRKKFDVDNLRLHSFALSAFGSLRDIFNSEKDFIFIDISGEVTEVSFVKDGVLRENQTFPIGRNIFLREIIKNFKTTYNGAISIMNIYNENITNQQTFDKIEISLEELKKRWLEFLEKGISELSQGAISPRTIYIIADDNMGAFFKKLIKDWPFTRLVFPGYNKTSNSILVTSKDLRNFCELGEVNEDDIFFGIELMFVNKFFE